MVLYQKIQNRIFEIYNKYFDQYFVLMPFFICIGVIIFVSTSQIIPLTLIVAILCCAVSIYIFCTYFWQIIYMPLIMIMFGIFIATVHNFIAENNNRSCLTISDTPIIIKINRIVYGAKFYVFGTAISIRNIPINCKVKIKGLELNNIKSGDTISFIGSIYAPSKQFYPRIDRVFIEKLGGKTFVAKVKEDVKIVQQAKIGFFDKIRSNIAHKISILSENGTKSGYGIVAALTIGNTGFIDETVLDNIRKSGFAHLLAISGLHLGIIISLVFVSIRWLLSLVPYICLNFNTKKIAAIIAILVSFCYLQIANGSISVQRSFIMCGLLLIGIILDKKAIMLRIWGVALFYVVIFMPDKIFMPSMQMSFVATFTLIAVYQKFTKKDNTMLLTNKNGLLFYIFTIFLSSFIAGFTTMFYEAYHFGQWSIIGLLSNELAIPVTEFLLLPISMLAIVFNDTFIGEWLYSVAGFLGDVLAFLANFFANQKFSYFLLKAMPPSSIFIITIGLYIIFITLNRWSLIGIFFIIIGSIIHFFAPKPIFLIDNRASQIVYLGDDNIYYTNKIIENNYIKHILSQELAQKDFTIAKNNFICNEGLCKYSGKKEICILEQNINRISSAQTICPNAEITIDLRLNAKSSEKNITANKLYKNGTLIVY